MATRFPDWSERLADFLAARRSMPFAWGSNDCCMFAADCVLLLTGKDFAEFRGEYEDARRAAELLLQVGGVEAIATRKLGDPIPWQMAQRRS